MPRILIAEDDPVFSRLLVEYLESFGHRLEAASTGDAAVAAVRDAAPDLLILDLMLPGKDGLEVCAALRPHWSGPILMLTAAQDRTWEIAGLRHGADDYVSKLAPPELLLARIDALLRRHGHRAVEQVIELPPLVVDLARRTATVHGAPMDLTSAELELLHLLAQRAGTPVSRDTMFEELRGIPYDGLDRSMDVRLVGLRKKLLAHGLDVIRAVRGVGYQLAAPSPATPTP